jgi:tRNA modification GTPase
LVSASIAVDGWPVELIDTAGERESADPLERSGIVLARQAARSADLTLWITDATGPELSAPTELNDLLRVRNKIDLASSGVSNDAAIPISALTAAGLDKLLSAISERLVPHMPPTGAPIPFSSAIADSLTRAANHLDNSAVQEASAELSRLIGGADRRNAP